MPPSCTYLRNDWVFLLKSFSFISTSVTGLASSTRLTILTLARRSLSRLVLVRKRCLKQPGAIADAGRGRRRGSRAVVATVGRPWARCRGIHQRQLGDEDRAFAQIHFQSGDQVRALACRSRWKHSTNEQEVAAVGRAVRPFCDRDGRGSTWRSPCPSDRASGGGRACGRSPDGVVAFFQEGLAREDARLSLSQRLAASAGLVNPASFPVRRPFSLRRSPADDQDAAIGQCLGRRRRGAFDLAAKSFQDRLGLALGVEKGHLQSAAGRTFRPASATR